jgi:GGDEF domain-containing protein
MQPSLTRLSSLNYGFMLLGLLLVGLALYFMLQDTQEQSQRHYGEYVSRNLATMVHDRIKDYQRRLLRLARTKETADALKLANAERESWVQGWQKKFPGILRLRLLGPGPHKIDLKRIPHFSYACIDMIRNTQSGKDGVSAELHMSATPSAHIAMVQAITRNKRDIGYLALSLRVNSFNKILLDNPVQGVIELRQYTEDNKFVLISSTGKTREAKKTRPKILVPVAETNWKIAYWPDGKIQSGLTIRMPVIILLVLAIVIIFSGLLLSYFLLRKTLQYDIKILTYLANDIRLGRLKQSYPVKLKESIKIAESLLQAGSKIISDIQDQKSSSQTDDLTGLPTLKAFNKRLEQLFGQNKLGFPSSLMLVDIDQFAKANEQYGHDTADLLLKNFAMELKRLVRQGDYVGRLGGCHFAVVFSLDELKDAEEIQKRVSGSMPMFLPIGKTDLVEIR